MNAFIALLRKDLRLYFSNRRAVLMSVAAPILIAAFFGSLFGTDSKPANVPVGISDLDRSVMSGKIVAALRADASLAVSELPQDEALAQVRQGKLRAAIVLPAGFASQASRALFGGGDKPQVGLVYDPSQAMTLPLVRGLLSQHVMSYVTQDVFSANSPMLKEVQAHLMQDSSLPTERRQDLLKLFDQIDRVQQPPASAVSDPAAMPARQAESRSFSLPFSTQETEAGAGLGTEQGRPYNSYAHSFAGMGVQFILMMGVDMGVGLLLLRRQGLWQRLRAAPVSRAKLLGSRIASCALIALLVFLAIYAVAMAVFKVRVDGSWLGFGAVLLAFSVLTASFGLLVAAIGKTPEATRGLAILVTLLMVMLGGAWVPSFIFPAWLQSLSLLMPTRWAVDGLDAMTWRAQGLAAAGLPVAVMLAFSLVFGLLALARFKWEE
ncbi:ABC transporter permease [Roseateles koreensis]|uniref:ABC transporter permease n=1 Tax=Roseateles koreensis TaxID=2987526 RepID=A0ABT5KV36_9BURK|nr:ABC transporter permease [Roseateles koreensis]MDC8785691.1 ABC transporter permease [Roseateles koreensis]